MKFVENDWSCFTACDLAKECDLLIRNMIADTCGLPIPDGKAAGAVKKYCEAGRPMLLLHGASSAFLALRLVPRIVRFPLGARQRPGRLRGELPPA
ncbi:MAG: hypothetical protein V8T86_18270 [Victivallis sp.]